MMCKYFKCTPSQLRKESSEDLELFSLVYQEIAKKNPMTMFM